ncbi:MAG: hypothetical protein ACYDAG_05005 [Chloroflexota bacterium]
MKLYIASAAGILVEVQDGIEDYDLTKPFAQSEVCESIRRGIELSRDAEAGDDGSAA